MKEHKKNIATTQKWSAMLGVNPITILSIDAACNSERCRRNQFSERPFDSRSGEIIMDLLSDIIDRVEEQLNIKNEITTS